MIVVDSSVWIDNIRNANTSQVELLRSANAAQIIVGDLIILEVLRGLRTEAEAAKQEERLLSFSVTPLADPDLAVIAASHYRWLRARGITIRSSVDLVIATFCLTYRHYLLHDDRDFDPFEQHLGLQVWR